MTDKKITPMRKRILHAYEENEYANLVQNRNRARSLTVGTSFSGIVEVSMRGDHHSLWCHLQPVEAIEIMEQLAAATGVQIAMRPKNDFTSWRGWQQPENEDPLYKLGSVRYSEPVLPPSEDGVKRNEEIDELFKESNNMVQEVAEEYNKDYQSRMEERVESEENNSKKYIKKRKKRKKEELKLQKELVEEFVEDRDETLSKVRDMIPSSIEQAGRILLNQEDGEV